MKRKIPSRRAIALLAACFAWVSGCESIEHTARLQQARGAVGAATPARTGTLDRRKLARLQPVVPPVVERKSADDFPPADLLERVRRTFVLPVTEAPPVDRERRWYVSHRDYFSRVLERSRPYLFYVVESLEARGMPGDLALLPVIESAYDPFAYSRGRAAGLWQIIPDTGVRLGLAQNWWYDGRRDLVDSTRAALDYLDALHAQFGDWLLAIAGYNAGENAVERAIARAARDGHPTDFWGVRRYLPRETQTYVPRLLAVRDLVRNPRSFTLELPSIANERQLAIVATGGQIDLSVAARLAQLEVDELYRLNPGTNRWATDPDGPHRLVVPLNRAAQLERSLSALDPRERITLSRHEIRHGDTLYALARHYSTTPVVLQELNGLRGTTIRAGESLIVPHAARASLPVSRASGASAASPAVEVFEATPLRGLPGRIRELVYIVRPGDSLAAIARRFRVLIDELLDWNGISVEDYLHPGQRLTLFVDIAEQSS